MKWTDIVSTNLWWKDPLWYSKDPDVSQALGFVVERSGLRLEPGNTYLIRGIRRSGKTVYLKLTVKSLVEGSASPRSIVYLSCDRLTGGRRELLNALKSFLTNFRPTKPIFMLDEITYLRDWYLLLKELAERQDFQNATIVATGSNPVNLRRLSERLPGRKLEGNDYLMLPLTFRQFLKSVRKNDYLDEGLRKASSEVSSLPPVTFPLSYHDEQIIADASVYLEELNTLFRDYLLTGGFPATVDCYFKNRSIDRKLYEEVVRVVMGDLTKSGKREDIAMSILRELVSPNSYAQRTNLNSLGDRIGHPHNTVGDYLNILEESFILINLMTVNPYVWRVKPKSLRKVFVTDPFLYHSINSYFSGLDGFSMAEDIVNDEDTCSRIVEGVVAYHFLLTRLHPYRVEKSSFLGFTYNNREEVDLLYRCEDGSTVAIQISYRSALGSVKPRAAGITIDLTLTKDEYVAERKIIPVCLLMSLLPTSPMIL